MLAPSPDGGISGSFLSRYWTINVRWPAVSQHRLQRLRRTRTLTISIHIPKEIFAAGMPDDVLPQVASNPLRPAIPEQYASVPPHQVHTDRQIFQNTSENARVIQPQHEPLPSRSIGALDGQL